MVQLKILSGKQAGTAWAARRFPVRVGRAAGCDLRSEEAGVHDRHLELRFDPAEGVMLTTQPPALVSINGETVEQAVLRNGDEIQAGSLKLQFWLNETRQGGLRLREWLIWIGIAAVTLGQVALIYWLAE